MAPNALIAATRGRRAREDHPANAPTRTTAPAYDPGTVERFNGHVGRTVAPGNGGLARPTDRDESSATRAYPRPSCVLPAYARRGSMTAAFSVTNARPRSPSAPTAARTPRARAALAIATVR